MEERYNHEEAEMMFDEMLNEVMDSLELFEKSFSYKQLTYAEQQSTQDIVLKIGEYMFDYHLQTLYTWNSKALQDVLIDIFPTKISADYPFFEKVEPVLSKYFDFLYYQVHVSHALTLKDTLMKVSSFMLDEVALLLEGSNEKSVFDLGKELGLDTSDLTDVEKLYRLVHYFDAPRLKEKIINLVQ